ncbi:hypothetical protein MRB53_020375 [Persea americana]|uniref:Uncharacterized protein n=1 Tax=Persea americana TaxID=3435 RepID=A0ACC2L1E2_PERAE|nr:hypothetical protein MRB53_020375 [Persea americana]
MNEGRRKKKKGRMTGENGTTVVVTSQLVTVGGRRWRREEQGWGGKKKGMERPVGVGLFGICFKRHKRAFWILKEEREDTGGWGF